MKKTIFSILALLVSMTTMAQYQPSEQVKQSQKEFQDFKFGIFIHWGIYSMLGDGEWVMNNKSINYQESAFGRRFLSVSLQCRRVGAHVP